VITDTSYVESVLYIGELHKDTKMSDIQEAFGVFGKIESCDMIKDPTTE
jgi:RNA recognition motif-containing protein